jgi:ribosome-binding factor A
MSNRRYSRTARLNELLREILGDELERLGDERLELVTISGVEVDAGLDHAVVFYSSFSEDDDEILEAFEEARRGLQAAVNRQTRIRATPRLEFRPDHGIRTGARIDEILSGLDIPDSRDEPPADGDGEPVE